MTGKIIGLYVCHKEDKVRSTPVQELEFTLEGPLGDRHSGFTKKADVRDAPIPKYINGERHYIRNWRQWSAVSKEECEEVAQSLNLPNIEASWLGANLCFEGIADFTQLPKGAMIHFPSGVILQIEGENEPCIHPGNEIASNTEKQDFQPRDFVIHAKNKRGLVGVVHKPGIIKVGEECEIKI